MTSDCLSLQEDDSLDSQRTILIYSHLIFVVEKISIEAVTQLIPAVGSSFFVFVMLVGCQYDQICDSIQCDEKNRDVYIECPNYIIFF